MSARPNKAEIRRFLITNVEKHSRGVVSLAAQRFGISRQAAHRHLKALRDDGVVTATGTRRGSIYALVTLGEVSKELPISPALEEHVVWRDLGASIVASLAENVRGICAYGFTEMVNNARDHSESPSVWISIGRTAAKVRIVIWDRGVGIFKKIQTACHLDDPREAVLELAKGKLTTDPQRHSGEGIFFTSRSFDSFTILSGNLSFVHTTELNDWLLEDRGAESAGTWVAIEIDTESSRTLQSVFDRFSSGEDFGFTKTQVPVDLARYEGENLVSRSQARRLLTRVNRFREVILDFEHVQTIGQAFADEIFRVYSHEHPEVHLTAINTNSHVAQMVARARTASVTTAAP